MKTLHRNKIFYLVMCIFLIIPTIVLAYPNGDTHIHSNWSSDSPFLTPNYYASRYQDSGFDFIYFTEHSDVLIWWQNYLGMKIKDANTYSEYVTEVRNLNKEILTFPGIELTVGNGDNWESEGHFITLSDTGYINPFETINEELVTLSVRRDARSLLDEYYSNGGEFGIVAHPSRVDPWNFVDFPIHRYSGKIGMELISAGGREPRRTTRQWDALLANNRKVTGVAGSDTHSWSLYLLGSAKTKLLIGEEGLTEEKIVKALQTGKVLATNGPSINFSVTGINGKAYVGDELPVSIGETVQVNVDYDDITDYYHIVRAFDATAARQQNPTPIFEKLVQPYVGGSLTFSYTVSDSTFLRLEVVDEFSEGRHYTAFTNPIRLTVKDKSTTSLDTAIIIDSSGSMGWNDPNNERKTQAKRFIDMMQVGDRGAVIDFDYYAYVHAPLTLINDETQRTVLKNAIDKIDSSGGTHLGRGLQAGYNELNKSPELTQKKAAIFLTDGVGTYNGEASWYAEKGWPVYTIGLGYDTNPALLQQIAAETGGRYYPALTADTLSEIYRELVKDVRGQTGISQNVYTVLPNQLVYHEVPITSETLEVTFNIDAYRTVNLSSATYSDDTTVTHDEINQDGMISNEVDVITTSESIEVSNVNSLSNMVNYTLISPSGVQLTSTTDDLHVHYTAGPTYAGFRITNPEPGTWTMMMEGVDVPEQGMDVEAFVHGLIQTPPTVNFTASPSEEAVSGTILLSAVAEDNEEILDVVLYIDGEPVAVSMDNTTLQYEWDTTQYEDGVYLVAVDAVDELLAIGSAELEVIVDNSNPIADAGTEVTGVVGEPVFFDASNSEGVSLYGYAWDFGDGIIQEYGRNGAVHTYNEPGLYTVTLSVYDDMGKMATDQTFAYIGVSRLPEISLSSEIVTASEGGIATNTITASDPEGNPLNVTASVGAVMANGDGTWTWQYQTTDGPDQSQDVTVTVSNGFDTCEAIFSLNVNNLPPEISQIAAEGDPLPVNTEIQVSATFLDPGVLDTHQTVWHWGDGLTSPGIVTTTAGSGNVSGSHSYLEPGVYSLKLTVTDKDGGADEFVFSQYIVVYDPCAGFVTGGGWIESPAGAYTLDTNLTGKASFGFISRYKKGASVPTGQTQFRFSVADLSFHSSEYEWLVIAGARAQYKGSGTINGTGNYGFMLTAIDGGLLGDENSDSFRIKIWDKENGMVVYDNQIGKSDTGDDATVLSGGNIIIHK